MKLPHWKISLSLVAIFLAGTVTGAVLTLRVIKRIASQQGQFEKLPDLILSRMQARLGLTPEQTTRIQPAVEQAAKELRDLRSRAGTTIFTTLTTMDAQIERELTSEQKPQFEKIRREIRSRLHLRPPPKPGEDPAPPAPKP